jgi:hypothetical protein
MGETHEVIFYDTCVADITVKKMNLASCEDDPATATPVEGFVFHITGPGVDADLPPTDAEGITTFQAAEPGTYTVCETLPQGGKNVFCCVTVNGEPATATQDTDTWCADVTVGCDVMGETHEVVFYDTCIADITVTKMSLESCEDDPATATPVEGFVFHITGPGVDADLPPTDAAGVTSYQAAEPGTYTVCETLPQGDKSVFCSATVDGEPASAHEDTDTWCVDVTVGCDVMGESHAVVVYNAEQKCEIQACKLDEHGEPIEGWMFQLWTAAPASLDMVTLALEPAMIAEDPTGPDGCVTWTDLEPGVYAVAEVLPQTVGGATYTKVDGDVVITEYCGESPTVIEIPAIQAPTGQWGVPIDLRDACCDATPDVSVVFSNTCEVEVTICKLAIQAPECDEMAETSPVSGWSFTLKHLPDGPETPYMTGTSGCTCPIVLDPGDYRVCESMDPIFMFCQLQVNGVDVDPTFTDDTNMDGIDDVICYDFTIDCEDVPAVEVTFANAGGRVTRTPGYWFTHPDALKAAFECITGSESGTIVLCESDGCAVDPDDAMAIFWTSKGGNRPTLAKHILAAMFNNCLLSPAPGSIIGDALAVLCDPEASSVEIGDVLGPLTEFNESGTDQELEAFDYGSADPAEAKSMAAMGTVPDCAAGKHIRTRTGGRRGR